MITETVIKRRGRPALGNVLFARRVSPAMARELEAIVKGGPRVLVEVGPVVEASGDVGKVRKQLEAMTKDYQFYYDRCEELELKVVAANQEAEAIAAWTEDEKMKYWRDRAMRCEAALKSKGGEFNQEG